MEGQPADEECKDNRENYSARSVFPGPLQAPCTNIYGHARDKYNQEWDEEAHYKAKNDENRFLFRCHGCRISTVDRVLSHFHKVTKSGIRDAADHGSRPNSNTYKLSFADSALVLCPHHHPDWQATVQTYSCQKKDTGKHVDNTHETVKLTHEMSRMPSMMVSVRNDRENQEGHKEEVSQGQVEKPNWVDRPLHPETGHVNDQTVAHNSNNKYHTEDDQGG